MPEENKASEDDVPVREYRQESYDEACEKLYTEILEHFRSFSPSEQIAGKITEEHITEYLEGNREERLQAFKERREKRFLSALELIAILTAVVLVVWFLGDNPAILVNILYIIGGLGEAVAACLCENCPAPLTRMGVKDVFGHSGPAVDLLKEFGLCAEGIEETVKKILK